MDMASLVCRVLSCLRLIDFRETPRQEYVTKPGKNKNKYKEKKKRNVLERCCHIIFGRCGYYQKHASGHDHDHDFFDE